MQTHYGMSMLVEKVVTRVLRLLSIAGLLFLLCSCATAPSAPTVHPSVVVKQVEGHPTYYYGD